MEPSKLKHLQRYTNPFELDYRKFEHLPQSHQLYTTSIYTIEKVSETLETADSDMT